MKKQSLNLLILCVLFSSCTVGPVYILPEVGMPVEWHSDIPEKMNTCSGNDLAWWETLQDPLLNQLIACAALQNLDLQIAAARVWQARREANAKKSDLYPHIDGSVGGGHIYYSKDALVNGLVGTAAPVKSHVRRNVNYYELGFDAEWEIDLFGMSKHEIAALKAHAEAVEESLCSIWVTLSAEIAKNYIEIRSLQARLAILIRTIKVQTQANNLTQELLNRGVVNEMELCKAEAECSVLRAQFPLLELEIDRAIHRISILLGYPPGELYDCLIVASSLPKLPDEMPIGMPSDLLRRRPDIRKAERELAAATERIGSAIASLFPRFSLNGFLGEISTKAGSLFSPASATWMAGPQLIVPIFNSRLILQDVQYNKMATQEALYNYQKVVLGALEESENAIISYRYESERIQNLEEVYSRYRRAESLARQLYQEGVHGSLKVIDSAKSALNSEDVMLQSQTNLLLAYVSLYKTLGGTWK
jgi:NodT family efflux transporter outer membrane factor (OMF) lipoprotein